MQFEVYSVAMELQVANQWWYVKGMIPVRAVRNGDPNRATWSVALISPLLLC